MGRKQNRFVGKQSDHWLLKYARRWGEKIDFSYVTPEYFQRKREDFEERMRQRKEGDKNG